MRQALVARRSKSSQKIRVEAPAPPASRRLTYLLPGGLYCFEDELAAEKRVHATFVTGTAWLLEVYELKRGAIGFLSGEREARSSARRFGAIFPPFSMARLCLDRAHGRVLGFAGSSALPPRFSETAMLFELRDDSADEPAAILRGATAAEPIPAWPHASALSRRAKKLIDERYLAPVSLAQIAMQLGVTAAHLSRQFKRDFQVTPSTYLHRLRAADVPLKLARGEEIVRVSNDVGYGDLSRFYKQFRKVTRTSPGACRASVAPTATRPGHR